MHIDTLRGYCACCDMKMSGISVLNYISRFLSANFNLIAYVPNKSSDQIGNWNLLNPEITLYRHQNDPFFTAYLMIEFHIIFESTTCWFSDREIRSQRNVLRYSCNSFSVHLSIALHKLRWSQRILIKIADGYVWSNPVTTMFVHRWEPSEIFQRTRLV